MQKYEIIDPKLLELKKVIARNKNEQMGFDSKNKRPITLVPSKIKYVGMYLIENVKDRRKTTKL